MNIHFHGGAITSARAHEIGRRVSALVAGGNEHVVLMSGEDEAIARRIADSVTDRLSRQAVEE